MENSKLSSLFVIIPLAIILSASCSYATLNVTKSEEEASDSGATKVQLTSTKPSTLPDFTDIAAQQGGAVVNISVSGNSKVGTQVMPDFPGLEQHDPFYEFFRRFQIPSPNSRTPTRGLGSGFIVSADGTILTNAHVVAEAEEVTVKLTDKREFKAKVLGADKLTDVAVLKINASGLPTVRIGDAQSARVGEWVVAIGSPFGFENSVTAGIISAKSRTLPDEGYVPFLQTDVAINPGNSGGPLFNLSGEVIGVNSQIYTRSGGYQGLSFAIPIDVAMKVEKQILTQGKVSHGRLGVTIQELTQELASSFGLDKPEGALVSSVAKASPAEKAGIEAGDVILKFNDKTISRSADLPPLVAALAPGSPAKLEIWHKGRAKTITLNVGEMQVDFAQGVQEKQNDGKLGLTVRGLTAEERNRAELENGEGVLVENVSAGPAAKAGLRTGDILLAINGEKIANANQLRRLAEQKGRRFALLVVRGGNKLFIPINVD